MFGNDIGSLSVYQNWNRTEKQLLWTRNTSADNTWRSARIDVESNEIFYVRINLRNIDSHLLHLPSWCMIMKVDDEGEFFLCNIYFVSMQLIRYQCESPLNG
jgi:hypothetical protein